MTLFFIYINILVIMFLVYIEFMIVIIRISIISMLWFTDRLTQCSNRLGSQILCKHGAYTLSYMWRHTILRKVVDLCGVTPIRSSIVHSLSICLSGPMITIDRYIYMYACL
jgi:hypothetical protein